MILSARWVWRGCIWHGPIWGSCTSYNRAPNGPNCVIKAGAVSMLCRCMLMLDVNEQRITLWFAQIKFYFLQRTKLYNYPFHNKKQVKRDEEFVSEGVGKSWKWTDHYSTWIQSIIIQMIIIKLWFKAYLLPENHPEVLRRHFSSNRSNLNTRKRRRRRGRRTGKFQERKYFQRYQIMTVKLTFRSKRHKCNPFESYFSSTTVSV